MTVLVTRADPGGSALCAKLKEYGYEAIHLPTIVISPPSNVAQTKSDIQLLHDKDWVVFVSPQAVIHSLPMLSRALPPSVNFAAVGKGTADALEAHGYRAIYPREDWSAEGLLNLPVFNAVAGKKIAIIRGEGGRELLEPALTSRGAVISTITVYRREMPPLDQAAFKKCLALLEEKRINAIICTSFTSVDYLKKMVGNKSWNTVKSVPLIVVSERIKKLAHNLGFQTISVAENASHQAIAETMKGMNDVR